MFFKCIVCNKWKNGNKENIKRVKHIISSEDFRRASYIHMSCLEEVIRNPENYRIQLVDKCVHIALQLREEMEERQRLKTKLVEEAKKIDMEIFLDKSKGKYLGEETA